MMKLVFVGVCFFGYFLSVSKSKKNVETSSVIWIIPTLWETVVKITTKDCQTSHFSQLSVGVVMRDRGSSLLLHDL